MTYTEKNKPAGECQACGQPKELTINEVLKDFFISQSAKSCKEDLWLWFINLIGSNDMDGWTAQDRSNLAFLYKQLTEFIEKLEVIYLKTSA